MSLAATAEAAFATPTGAYAGSAPPEAPSALRPSVQQIVRNALHADALTSPSAERAVLERELDRLQPLVAAEQAALGQQLNWTMLSQALLLNVFILALVFGTSPGLPGKRWLLAGIAVFATLIAVLAYFAFRASRHSLRGLLRRRNDIETALQALGRQPVFATGDRFTRGLGAMAARLLPTAFIAGWVGVSIYALAAPGAGAVEPRVSVAPPTSATAPATRVRGATGRAVTGGERPAVQERAAPAERGIAAGDREAP